MTSSLYNFDKWDELPMVSCQCITYGRPEILGEAVESFLRQDYEGEKELVILNDQEGVELFCEEENVRVINAPKRLNTLGGKRNACVSYCNGEYICCWDDDDISLPHRISRSIEGMTNKFYYKPFEEWEWSHGEISPVPASLSNSPYVNHNASCFSKDFFDKLGGYPLMDGGEDSHLDQKLRESLGGYDTTPLTHLSELFYIYRRYGVGIYRMSDSDWKDGYRVANEAVVKNKYNKEYEIKPFWSQDYLAMVEDIWKL